MCGCSAISGGSYLKTNIVKGRVSNVGFASDFITTQTQVQNVYLGNLNLVPTLTKLTTILPPTIRTLELNNGLLTTFPKVFSSFTALQELCVASKLSDGLSGRIHSGLTGIFVIYCCFRVRSSLSNNYIAGVDSSIVINTISQL